MVLWWMLLERIANNHKSRSTRSGKTAAKRTRCGRAFVVIISTTLGAMSGVVSRFGDPNSRIGRWFFMPSQFNSAVFCLLGSVFLLAPMALIDSWVFGYDYSARHETTLYSMAIGLLAGTGSGVTIGIIAFVTSGLDE
ncbi:hypothetical protein [Phytohabitans houttuyneae]|uniref:hypothetical protein n=1 Tax=Phytohabitans houttuyneae TaxID=1076126 RepID=UPI0015634C8B|nr:hypothetical protein [Phytohabitans houttuyneae]